MSHTCGECKRWIDDEPWNNGPKSCYCPIPDYPNQNFGLTCPAFDNGDLDRAVDALIEAAQDELPYLDRDMSNGGDDLRKAIAAVIAARKERT